MSTTTTPSPADPAAISATPRRSWNHEDWWSIAVGFLFLFTATVATIANSSSGRSERVAALAAAEQQLDGMIEAGTGSQEELEAARKQVTQARKAVASNPFAAYVGKIGGWKDNPREAFVNSKGQPIAVSLVTMFAVMGLLFGVGSWALGRSFPQFLPGFVVLCLLAVLAEVLAAQATIKHYNLEFALWALLVGLLISNTVGTPSFLKAAANTEFYIKTGLVLLGAEVLFHRLLALGLPGIFVSWVVTPVVLISTYAFGQRILRMESRSLNMVISADMSVCGVSAAIATAAACRAKKEELSLAIALSLAFTVVMMVVMPAVIKASGMSEVLGGAWIGGTIDSTGAVAAAGGMLGPVALEVAATVKMIQNILIGAVAFGVAAYWVAYVEPTDNRRPRISEIWQRFPRFILGFVGASIAYSLLSAEGVWGDAVTSAVIDGTTKTIRGWCFCLAFVSIGLESNFRELWKSLKGGKPLVLYVCGQTLNLVLTLAMAWLMFERVFPNAAKSLG